ncbi:MAG: hypothetical protein HOO87_16570 [Methyloglobulus sp.]|nr:hypothetical protein [Methyloglobulus sp.]
MNQANKHYEAAFKLDVARMVVNQGLGVVQVVNGMKIGRTAVRRWVGQYRAEQWGKPFTAGLQRIRQPETEGRQLKSDNGPLKKASAFYALWASSPAH